MQSDSVNTLMVNTRIFSDHLICAHKANTKISRLIHKRLLFRLISDNFRSFEAKNQL